MKPQTKEYEETMWYLLIRRMKPQTKEKLCRCRYPDPVVGEKVYCQRCNGLINDR